MTLKAFRLPMFLLTACCLLLALTASPAMADPEPSYPKYCQGKYLSLQGTEVIITVGCFNLTDTCTCGADGVHCGGRHHEVGNMTFVSGSCGEIWTPDPNA